MGPEGRFSTSWAGRGASFLTKTGLPFGQRVQELLQEW